MDGEYLDIKGAADFLGLKPRTLTALASQGVLPSYAIGPRGGRTRFKASDLRAYVDSCQRVVSRRVDPSEYRSTLVGRPDGQPIKYL